MATDGLMIQNGRLQSQPIPFLGQESWTSPPPWVHPCPFQPPALEEPPRLEDEGQRGEERGRTQCIPEVPLSVPLILTFKAVFKQTQRAPCRYRVCPSPGSSRVTAGVSVLGHHTPLRGRARRAPGHPGRSHRVCLQRKTLHSVVKFSIAVNILQSFRS